MQRHLFQSVRAVLPDPAICNLLLLQAQALNAARLQTNQLGDYQDNPNYGCTSHYLHPPARKCPEHARSLLIEVEYRGTAKYCSRFLTRIP